jgi:hypothetical protein
MVNFLALLAKAFGPLLDRQEAENRALNLLLSQLSPPQLDQFRTHDRFEVRGNNSGDRFIIRNSPFLNVEQLNENGDCIRKWCFVPRGNLARGDVLLTQKLALECFEAEALYLAAEYTPDNTPLASRRRNGY